MTLHNNNTDESRIDKENYPMGIPELDNEILNGIPKGSMVAIIADARGMSQLFNYHLVHTDRPTHYITTGRDGKQIKNDIKQIGTTPENLTIADTFTTSDTIKELLLTHSARLKDGHNLILDTATGYNINSKNQETYLQTLRNIQSNIHEKNAIGYLNYITENPENLTKTEKEALHMCDVILHIKTTNNGDQLDTILEIHKIRGKDFTDEVINLNINKTLTIDNTREIA